MLNYIKNLFRKKESEKTINRIELDRLWGEFKEEKFSKVESELKILLENSNKKPNSEILKLLGLCYFRQGKYNLSEEIFIKQTENSKNSDDWFNLVTSSTLNKNIELSEKAFKKTVEFYEKNGKEDNLPIPYVYFYYMQGLRDVKEYEKAFTQLEKLKDIYSTLSITDTHFLYMRGIPFFEETLDASKEILENSEKDKVVKFISDLKEKIDEDGKKYLEEFENTIKYSS